MTEEQSNEPTIKLGLVWGESLRMASDLLGTLFDAGAKPVQFSFEISELLHSHFIPLSAPGANDAAVHFEASDRFLELLAALGASEIDLEAIKLARHGYSS